MRSLILALPLSALVLSGCSTSLPRIVATPEASEFPPKGAVVERVRDLGYGFRRVTLARPVQVSFESIGHFGYLYYQNVQLCQLGECSISPSGDYALFQDGPTGNLYLFHRMSGRLSQLTSRFPGLVDRCIWQEDQAAVVVRIATSGRPERTFALDEKAQPIE